MSLVRPLDRYVFVEWMKIFVASAIGLPVLLVIIDLTDHLQQYLTRNIPAAELREERIQLVAPVAAAVRGRVASHP